MLTPMATAPAITVEAPLAQPPTKAPFWSDGLTAKETAFVEHWQRYRNATQAYSHAFDCDGSSYETRRLEGCRLLNSPKIATAIQARQKIATQESGVDAAWLARRFLDIATADPRELIGLKVGCCRYCHGEAFGYQWREREYMEALEEAERMQKRFPEQDVKLPDPGGGFGFNATLPPRPDCPQCHGEGLERFVPRDTDNLSEQALLLYGGVKVKKDGYEIITADRSKALELAGRILGAFTENVRLTGGLGHLHAIADLRSVDPQAASKAYQQFIAGHLSAG